MMHTIKNTERPRKKYYEMEKKILKVGTRKTVL